MTLIYRPLDLFQLKIMDRLVKMINEKSLNASPSDRYNLIANMINEEGVHGKGTFDSILFVKIKDVEQIAQFKNMAKLNESDYEYIKKESGNLGIHAPFIKAVVELYSETIRDINEIESVWLLMFMGSHVYMLFEARTGYREAHFSELNKNNEAWSFKTEFNTLKLKRKSLRLWPKHYPKSLALGNEQLANLYKAQVLKSLSSITMKF